MKHTLGKWETVWCIKICSAMICAITTRAKMKIMVLDLLGQNFLNCFYIRKWKRQNLTWINWKSFSLANHFHFQHKVLHAITIICKCSIVTIKTRKEKYVWIGLVGRFVVSISAGIACPMKHKQVNNKLTSKNHSIRPRRELLAISQILFWPSISRPFNCMARYVWWTIFRRWLIQNSCPEGIMFLINLAHLASQLGKSIGLLGPTVDITTTSTFSPSFLHGSGMC